MGSRIILGCHRAVNGDTSWSEVMAYYVGRQAVVSRLEGANCTGCSMVLVDVDRGLF